jgi:hypothetical protein
MKVPPQFATESEEAKWWDDQKEMAEENLIQAIRSGTAQGLVREARTSRTYYPFGYAGAPERFLCDRHRFNPYFSGLLSIAAAAVIGSL